MKRLLPFLLAAAAHGEDAPVNFERDVAPILHRRCANCHNAESDKGGYRLDTFARLLKPGDSEAPPVVAAKPGESELLRLLTTSDEDERMPQKAAALPENEITLIRRWIEQGAVFSGDHTRPLAQLVRAQHIRPAPAKYPRPVPATALAFSADSRRLAVNGYREITLWDPATAVLVRRAGSLPERITGLDWNPKRNLIAVAGGTPGQWGTVAIVEPERDYAVRFLCDLPDLVLSVAFSPDGNTLAAGCPDRSTRIFDVSSGKELRLLRQHADWVQSVAFDPAGRRLVTASRDRTARVLDASSWEVAATYQGHDAALAAAVFTADGSVIVSAGRENAHLWRPEGAARRGDFSDLGGGVTALASGPFGISAACMDGAMRLFQPGERTPWLTLPGHHEAVTAVTVNRHHTLLASGSADGGVIVWSPSCWAPVARFTAVP